MALSVNAGLSALRAFGSKIGVHADNIANMYTNGFRRHRAVLKSTENQTVAVEIDRTPSPGGTASKTSEDQAPMVESNVDVAREMVGAMTSQKGYEANAKAIKTGEEMAGTLLDLLK